MIKTEYICDKCGVTVSQKRNLFKVAIYVDDHATNWRRDWCRTCMAEIGEVQDMEGKFTAQDPPVTLEDLIREIVQEEISNQ